MIGLLDTGAPSSGEEPIRMNLLPELVEAVDQRLWPRGASRDVYVDGNHGIDPFEDIVGLEVGTSGYGALPHGYAPLRLWHLLPKPDDRGGELLADWTIHQKNVTLPWA